MRNKDRTLPVYCGHSKRGVCVILAVCLFHTLFAGAGAAAQPHAADVWVCRRADSAAPFFTTSPASDVGRRTLCRPAGLAAAPYNKLSYVLPALPGIDAPQAGKPLFAARQPALRTTFFYQELGAAGRRRMSRLLSEKCKVWGEAAGPAPGAAILSIKRGGATVDKHPIFVQPGFRPVRWETVLRGRCTTVSVSVSAKAAASAKAD